jgi:dienelactone hydrolase
MTFTSPRILAGVAAAATAAVLGAAALTGTALAGPAGPAAPTGSTPAAKAAAPPADTATQPVTTTGAGDQPPIFPEFTVKAPNGLLVNKCVPKALRNKTISLRTSDGVRLSAIVLGTGKHGVVLSHEQGYNICSWLALGQTLASRGYHVMLPEYRFHGASAGKSNDHLDRDLTAAVKELARRGATRIVAGGASCGGSASIVLAPKISGFTGLIVMSSPRVCGDLNALKVVKTIRQPSFFAFSPGDMTFEAEVRGLHKASGARDKRLVIARGGVHGTDMLRNSPDASMLRTRLLTFVDDAYRAAG